MAPVALAAMGSMSAAVIARRGKAVTAAQAPAAIVDAPPEDVATS